MVASSFVRGFLGACQPMDLAKVLHQLHEELENLNAAILSLERLQETNKNRGQQTEWLEQMEKPARGRRKRKVEEPGNSDPDK